MNWGPMRSSIYGTLAWVIQKTKTELPFQQYNKNSTTKLQEKPFQPIYLQKGGTVGKQAEALASREHKVFWTEQVFYFLIIQPV